MNRPLPLPPPNTELPYSELFTRALNMGLGMSEPNKDGDWTWYDMDFAVAVGRNARSISYWKTGDVLPSRKSHHLIKDMFQLGEDGEAAALWNQAFDRAFDRAKSTTGAATHAGVEFRKSNHKQITGAESDLRSRLARLTPDPPVLVGPTYLDFILYPVTTDHLEPDVEYSTLRRPEILLGGSTAFIGRYIHRIHGSKPDLITTTPSKGTALSDTWWEKVNDEQWIGNLVSAGETDDPAITFALRHARDGQKTMFTYPSGKEMFGWDAIHSYLDTQSGRVLHFSGLVKTELRVGFLENLEAVAKDHVTVFDHGRFTPDQKEKDYQNLIVEALNYGLIDYQITSLRDLAALYDVEFDARNDFGWDERKAIIYRVLEKRGDCERTNTIVRDYDYSRRTTITFVIVMGKVILVEEQSDRAVRFPEGFAYAANKFNAAFISRLHSGYKKDDDFQTATLRLVEKSYETLIDFPRP